MRITTILFVLHCLVSYSQDTISVDVPPLQKMQIIPLVSHGIVADLNLNGEFYTQQTFSLKNHSFLKPIVDLQKELPKTIRNSNTIRPLVDLHAFTTENHQIGYRTGAGISWKGYYKYRWHFKLNAVQGIYAGDSLYNPRSYLNWKQGNTNLYTDIRSRISYSPNQIFNFQVGVDHNFFGEGSRSLFLSDYGNPYPFGLIRTRFWRAEYSILYQFLREGSQGNWGGKFASSHHISLNATKWLNIGIFESVIFNPNDTLLHRGFEVEYLNPIVFYRPQEYSLGSSDNVLLGIDLTARVRRYTIYAQFILDEFYLKEIRAHSQWWANKFGGQFGAKGRFDMTSGIFYVRSEFNFVRPYTYAHLNDKLNYANQGMPLAHPYGANFAEALVEAMFARNSFMYRAFVSYSLRGGDSDTYNYGTDIYLPYINRPYEYGHFIGQGNQRNQWFGRLTVEWKPQTFSSTRSAGISLFAEGNVRYTVQSGSVDYFLLLGVRRKFWNDYRNY